MLYLGVLSISAQECVNFHKQFCLSYEKQGYSSLQESRSFLLSKGDFAFQRIVFSNGQDYHINFAVDDIFANYLYVQIIDNQTNEVLFDNKNDNMSLNMEFSAVRNIDAKIYFETPTPRSDNLNYTIKGCIGLLIETRPTPPTGFPE